MSTMPTRIDGDLFATAKAAGAVESRSAAQQLAHWARVGRELEASHNVGVKDVERVLAGKAPYDALAEWEQAVVRATREERLNIVRSQLDLAAELIDTGASCRRRTRRAAS